MSARQYTAQLNQKATPFYFYDMDLLNRTLDTAMKAGGGADTDSRYTMR